MSFLTVDQIINYEGQNNMMDQSLQDKMSPDIVKYQSLITRSMALCKRDVTPMLRLFGIKP